MSTIHTINSPIRAHPHEKDVLLDIPDEYLRIVYIVTRLSESNHIYNGSLSFTINAGGYAGYLGAIRQGNDSHFAYYSSLNPFKLYEDESTNEVIRQSRVYGDWNALAYSNGTISISLPTFRLANDVQLACTIAHEIVHVRDSHAFLESIEKGEFEVVSPFSKSAIDLHSAQLSRKYEKQADRGAWLLLRRAGYPDDACTDTLAALHRSAGIGSPTTPLSTHPGYKERLRSLQEFISSVQTNDLGPESMYEPPEWSFDKHSGLLTFFFSRLNSN